jgi:hypothetical protein
MKFGLISILSNLKDDPRTIHNLYKQRGEIEQVFYAMKNELENDKSYLSDDDSLMGTSSSLSFLFTCTTAYLY